MKERRRPYVLRERAAATAATRQRILESTIQLHFERTYDELALEDIAHAAGTTARTVLRLFGSKEQLVGEALAASRSRGHGPVEPGNVEAALRALFDDYERFGDAIMLRLADEHRIAAAAELAALGRATHRTWVEAAFAPQLARIPPRRRVTVRAALLVALDVYSWKLLRRDLALKRNAAQDVVRAIVAVLTEGD